MNKEEPTRGERNNNPGNIVKTDIQWLGEDDHGMDTHFETFVSADRGIRALAKLLRNYGRANRNTVRTIIHTYAPPVENDTDAYVTAVAKEVGVNPDTLLTLTDAGLLVKLCVAIIRHENGRVNYSLEYISEAVATALV